MYTNLGKKIVLIGKIIGWILLAAGIVVWLIFITNTRYGRYGDYTYTADDIWGWVSLAAGVLGFISSWFICAYGQLVDDVNNIRSILETPKADPRAADAEILQKGGWNCSCGRVNASYVATCACGKNKSDN